MTPTHQDRQTTHRQCLAAGLEEVRQHLQQYVIQIQESQIQESQIQESQIQESQIQENHASEPEISLPVTSPEIESLEIDAIEPESSLHMLCAAFNLTAFERWVLLLCAGVELSASIARLCAAAQGNPQFAYPTFSLALAVFPEAHWDALAPVAPLRHWRLIEMGNSDSLTQSRLRIDERVLHYLSGVPYLDERLHGLIHPLFAPNHLLPSHQQLAQRTTEVWNANRHPLAMPIVHFCGSEPDTQMAIAAVACAEMGMGLFRLRAIDIPAATAEREALARLWEREAVLSRSALLLDCDGISRSTLTQTVIPFVEGLQTRLVIVAGEPFTVRDRPLVHLEVGRSSWAEQRLLWQQALQPWAIDLNGHLDQIDQIISQFHLSATAIEAVCAEVESQANRKPALALAEQLWETCRIQTRPRLSDLAQRISPQATWDDLVLPAREYQMLREIAAQVRQQAKVYDTWGFARRGANGLGISTLFAGASGTGKTLAAEVLAHDLQLDLYRIDLSQVVSKYIGETEKNLRQVFDAAEAGGAILLFDEADALFGKRSDIKDSHDRYANIEVSYLLQRMEAYRGLAILTTNLKKAIDTAFLRRLRIVVQFPFPNVEQRLEIWKRIFPAQLPTQGLDFQQLARLNIAGGNIRNIALNAAFLAADEDVPVQMRHLRQAAKTEYSKLEKTLTDTEIGGWE
jgi:hypothetical protein